MRLLFTCGEKKIYSSIKRSQNIMNIIVAIHGLRLEAFRPIIPTSPLQTANDTNGEPANQQIVALRNLVPYIFRAVFISIKDFTFYKGMIITMWRSCSA